VAPVPVEEPAAPPARAEAWPREVEETPRVGESAAERALLRPESEPALELAVGVAPAERESRPALRASAWALAERPAVPRAQVVLRSLQVEAPVRELVAPSGPVSRPVRVAASESRRAVARLELVRAELVRAEERELVASARPASERSPAVRESLRQRRAVQAEPAGRWVPAPPVQRALTAPPARHRHSMAAPRVPARQRRVPRRPSVRPPECSSA